MVDLNEILFPYICNTEMSTTIKALKEREQMTATLFDKVCNGLQFESSSFIDSFSEYFQYPAMFYALINAIKTQNIQLPDNFMHHIMIQLIHGRGNSDNLTSKRGLITQWCNKYKIVNKNKKAVKHPYKFIGFYCPDKKSARMIDKIFDKYKVKKFGSKLMDDYYGGYKTFGYFLIGRFKSNQDPNHLGITCSYHQDFTKSIKNKMITCFTAPIKDKCEEILNQCNEARALLQYGNIDSWLKYNYDCAWYYDERRK